MSGWSSKSLVITGLLFSGSANLFATELTTGKDEQSLLPYWQIEDPGMSLRLVQRLPDQVRGFYMARGFSPEHAERIAMSCGFQTVFKNNSHQSRPGPLSYNLRDWVVKTDGKKQGLKTREDWEEQWKKTKADESSRLAFKWSLVPTKLEYKANDYSWGLSYFNLKPGTVFDLKVVWQQYQKTRAYIIRNIQCAPDIHPDPEQFRNQ